MYGSAYKDQRWCEKTPKYVMAFSDIYNLLDGKVKLIHIVRDGRDVVTSVHPNHPGKFWVDAERWINDTKAGLQHEEATYLLKYEDLVTHPEETLRKLCSYIGEPFDDELLNYSSKTTVQSNVAWEKNAQNIHAKCVGRWKNPEYSERVQLLMDNDEAMELMKRLNYN